MSESPSYSTENSELRRQEYEEEEETLKHRYHREIKLGEGTYGDVFKGTDSDTNQVVAIKKVKFDNIDEGIPSTALREIAVLKELKHENIVQLFDVCNRYSSLFLIFEYCDTDLHKYIYSDNYEVSLKTIQLFMYQILKALAYMHDNRIIHRDIKPSNIFINNNKQIKLGDFGLARSIGIPIKQYTKDVVTIWYRAPEIIMGMTTYSSAIDIWSTATVCGEMVMKKPLFKGDSSIDLMHKIFDFLGKPSQDQMDRLFKGNNEVYYDYEFQQKGMISNSLKIMGTYGLDLLKKMFEYNPGKRLSAKECLNHPFFKLAFKD